MRIFTEKDLNAATAALQVFLRQMDGKARQIKSLRPVVDTAVEGGITLDELFNKYNYLGAVAVSGGAISPEEYVNALVGNAIAVREVTRETDWADDYDNISILSAVFHRFFIEIKAKGGQFNTNSARLNLERAIRRFSLQAILSEELIKEVADAQGDKLTCFNYLVALLHKTEDFNVVMEPTKDTLARQELIKATVSAVIGGEPEEQKKTIALKENPPGSFVAIPDEEVNDPTLYGDPEPDLEDWLEEKEDSGVNIITQDPSAYKRECVLIAVMGLSLDEAKALAETVEDGEPQSIELFVEALCEGRFNPNKENLTARGAHQGINNEITHAFMECVRLQGFELDEDTVQRYDPLKDCWDMRDDKTRKIQKITKLVYLHGEDDPDLKQAVKDLETLYGNS